jgi:transcriptional regulator with XRE-family HTH domain
MAAADDRTGGTVASLGDRLREARCHARLTIREMGERLGASSAVVNGYERDETPVPDSVLATYAELTGVAADWIRSGVGSAPVLRGD